MNLIFSDNVHILYLSWEFLDQNYDKHHGGDVLSYQNSSFQFEYFLCTLYLIQINLYFQSAVIKVLEYHINWFEATGFSDKQVLYFILHLFYLSSQNVLTKFICIKYNVQRKYSNWKEEFWYDNTSPPWCLS
jgi:hypothetical protein